MKTSQLTEDILQSSQGFVDIPRSLFTLGCLSHPSFGCWLQILPRSRLVKAGLVGPALLTAATHRLSNHSALTLCSGTQTSSISSGISAAKTYSPAPNPKPIVCSSKVMLKIIQARLRQYVNRELPDVQAGFRKGRGTRDQIANIHWIMEKAREFQKKTSISALLTMPKPLTVWITINCGKFFKRWEHQTTWPASWETYMQVRKQQLELDMEQTGSK